MFDLQVDLKFRAHILPSSSDFGCSVSTSGSTSFLRTLKWASRLADLTSRCGFVNCSRDPGRWETAGYSTQDLCKRLVRFVNSGAAVALSVFTSPRAFAQLYKYPINSYLKFKNPILRTSRDKKRGRAELHTELRTRLRTGTVTELHATYGEVSGRY